jgi:RNA polymerase sigma-70 factor, ECF subfamily
MGGSEEFHAYRGVLLGLAYRLLGSMWDAEDVLQDAYLRWSRTDRSGVDDARAYLMTIVTRLCVDQQRSSRVRRETYVGPWLPEPVATATLGPMESAELRDTVSYATLHLMERLSPPERAVFVLREAFAFPYDRIAPVIDATAAACRQLYRRAIKKLSDGSGRFSPDHAEHAKLLTAFVDAARDGDLASLTELLSADVVAWNDGGGNVRAALRPIAGRERVLAFLAGLLERYPLGTVRTVQANGQVAVRIALDGTEQFVTAAIRDGRIHTIYAVLNPDKLTRLDTEPVLD